MLCFVASVLKGYGSMGCGSIAQMILIFEYICRKISEPTISHSFICMGYSIQVRIGVQLVCGGMQHQTECFGVDNTYTDPNRSIDKNGLKGLVRQRISGHQGWASSSISYKKCKSHGSTSQLKSNSDMNRNKEKTDISTHLIVKQQ